MEKTDEIEENKEQVEQGESTAARLSPDILLSAYTQGYFPMPDPETEEILWYRPSPRAIFEIGNFHLSKSMKKFLKTAEFEVRFSTDFEAVMRACANRDETWISEEFIEAYKRLHSLGFAHSVEVYSEGELVGGTYGVCIRSAFFAESMFHTKTNMSKVALWALDKKLSENGFTLFECQFMTPHLQTLGAVSVMDEDYQELLRDALNKASSFL